MKDKIIEILQSETWNVTNEAGDLCTVIEEEDFDSLAERIVKLFAIPAVVGELTCDSCGCHPNVIYTTSKGRFCERCKPVS